MPLELAVAFGCGKVSLMVSRSVFSKSAKVRLRRNQLVPVPPSCIRPPRPGVEPQSDSPVDKADSMIVIETFARAQHIRGPPPAAFIGRTMIDSGLTHRTPPAAFARTMPSRTPVASFCKTLGCCCTISRNGPARFRVNGPTLHGLPAEPRFGSSTRPFSLRQVFWL